MAKSAGFICFWLKLRVLNAYIYTKMADIGILGDHSSDGKSDYIEFDIGYVSEIVPYWELIYELKKFQNT